MTGEGQPRRYDREDRLLDFTCGAIDVVESVVQSCPGNHIAGQLVRCGTSPLGNYAEAQSAESRRDFIHKLKIILKELRETRAWLLVLQRKGLSTSPERLADVLTECGELIRIFQTSITTAERNREKARAGP